MSQRRVVLVIARGVYQGEMRARKKKRRWSPRPPPFHGAHSSLTCPGYRREITKKAARWRVVSRAAWRRRKRGSCELADARLRRQGSGFVELHARCLLDEQDAVPGLFFKFDAMRGEVGEPLP